MLARLPKSWPAWAAILLALAVFAPVCGHEFISWDDTIFVAGNPAIVNPTLNSLAGIWKHPEPGLYIPLPYTVWWGLGFVGQVRDAGRWVLNPNVFHAANWLMHGVFVGLIYALLRQMRCSPIAAGIGAAAAGVHPIAVETVAWTMGLRDQLAAIFALATLLSALRSRPWPAAGVMLLAILSKPTAIVVWPLAVVLIHWNGELSWKKSLRRAWPLAIVAAIGLLLTRLSDQGIHPGISELWQRPLIAGDALAFYVGKLACPWPLAFDYARTPAAIFASKAAWWTWAIPVLLAIAIWRSHSRVLWSAGALFLLPLLPVLGLIPFSFESLSTVADHYAYPALAGVACAIAIACDRWQKPARATAAILLVLWTGLSIRQTAAWSDDPTFFTFMTTANPTSGPAWDGLARTHLAAGDLSAADAAITRAIAANPDYGQARLTALQIKAAQHDTAGVAAQIDALEAIARKQSNFDPQQIAAMRARFLR